jgi:hypothetical protein
VSAVVSAPGVTMAARTPLLLIAIAAAAVLEVLPLAPRDGRKAALRAFVLDDVVAAGPPNRRMAQQQ